MPSIHLPYINIALDSFALLVTITIFLSCIKEFSPKGSRSNCFVYELAAIIVALVADIVSWLGEGHPSLRYVTIISNTVAFCAGLLVIIFFMGYLKENLYESSKVVGFILNLFRALCGFTVLFSIGNAVFGYVFFVNEQGHWHHVQSTGIGIIYVLFPVLSFFAIVLMSVFAKSSTKINRAIFIIYILFPAAGVIIDYTFHGWSLTYVGLTMSALVIYTNIYLKKQRLIESQQNALMISQINPHFVYNTLSTIASMCDVAPAQAKHLTIDFSRYLRQNLSNLTQDKNIAFEQEIEHVECYLKIEKARFRERLNVIYSIGCRDFEIPPLTVQPLVENAVKHGITKKAEGGTIKISTYDTATHYVVEIIDDGVGFDCEKVEMHVGIANVRSRIMSMCKGELSVKSMQGVGTRVTIEIPKKKGKRK